MRRSNYDSRLVQAHAEYNREVWYPIIPMILCQVGLGLCPLYFLSDLCVFCGAWAYVKLGIDQSVTSRDRA